MWAIYLANTTQRYEELRRTRLNAHLVEGKHSVVNVPVLHIDLSMRGICNTVNRDLELLRAFLSSFSANLLSWSITSTAKGGCVELHTCLTTDLTSTTDPRIFEQAVIATIRVFCVISGKRVLTSWATAYGLLEPFTGVACQ